MALLAASCTGSRDSKPMLTVSIEPERYLLEQIAGPGYEVNCMLAEGANPESYDPSMSRMRSLEKSRAYMMMGHLPFEEAMIERVRHNNPTLHIYNVSEGIEPILGTHTDHSGHGDTEADPHVWTSVKNARIIAANMLAALKEVEPGETEAFERRHALLDRRLDSMDRAIAARLAPHSGEAFLVWHPSLSYFARDYSLRQLSLSPEGKEAAVGQLQQAVDSARASGARTLFFQEGLDSRQAMVANRGIGAAMVEINPLSHDWEGQLTAIADALAR